jgi:hypothetical protein
MGDFCNQCGKKLQDGELCTCKKATERRLKSLPNSSPIQVEIEQEDIQCVEEVKDIEVQQKTELEIKTETELETSPEENNRAADLPKEQNIISNMVFEPIPLEEFPPVISGVSRREKQEQRLEEPEIQTEEPIEFPTEEVAIDLSLEEETLVSDPEAYREAVEKADPINVHNSSEVIMNQNSKPVILPYLNKIREFFLFIVDSYKNPSDTLSAYVKEGSKIKAILLIVIEAILGASLVTIILANAKNLITSMVAEIFLLTGYSEQFPLMRGFVLTLGLMLAGHIIFMGVLDIFKSLNIGGCHNTICISSVRAIATIPFLIIGHFVLLVHPLIGLPFWIIGNVLAIFFVIAALKEEWKEEMNKSLYILFITFLITTIIVGILFGLTCSWYLPEATVTRWVN